MHALPRSSTDERPSTESLGGCLPFPEESVVVDWIRQPILLRLYREATQIRLGTLPRESGKVGNPLEGDYYQGARGGRERPVDSSIHAAHYPTPSTPRSAPSGQYMPVLPSPIVHPPLAKIVECDQEPHVGTAGVPSEWQGAYRDIRSWSSIGSELPSGTLYASHASVHGVALENRGTSSMHDRTGIHMHSYSS